MKEYKKPGYKELRAKLTPEQYEVTQQCGTEPAFINKYYNNFDEGIYVDVVTGEPLFSSIDKYDSRTGWPSFTKPLEEKNITYKQEMDGKKRLEVRSLSGESHLGHVFEDGPAESGGKRFCINSASLKFIAKEDLEKSGYGEYLSLFSK